MATSNGTDPTYPPLAGDAGRAAVNGQMVVYPKVVRSGRDLPVAQQAHGMMSFMLFEQPRVLKTGKKVHGFIKLRGNWADEDQCKLKSANLIREQDSKYKVRIGEVGAWLPITDEQGFEQSIDVKADATEEEKMKEEAIRKKQDEDKRIMRELKEREEEVKTAKDYHDDPDGIDYYTMNRTTWMWATEQIDIMANRLKDMTEKVADRRKLLGELDAKHPEHTTAWIANYNKERRKAGIPDWIPSEQMEKRYADTNVLSVGPVGRPGEVGVAGVPDPVGPVGK